MADLASVPVIRRILDDRHATESVFLRGDDLREFCDAMEAAGQVANWANIRSAHHVLGESLTLPRTWLDETQRTWIGQAFGYDWFVAYRGGM